MEFVLAILQDADFDEMKHHNAFQHLTLDFRDLN
jgi:hypothetical protein